MKRRLITKLLIASIFIGMIFQVGMAVIAADLPDSSSTNIESTDITDNVVISSEVQNKIKELDSVNYERNLSNYKNLLVTFNVHEKFKNEIERLILDGYKLPDILTAYEFLFYSFGVSTDLESLIIEKNSGKTWEKIFINYNQTNPEFVPRAFEQEYLEDLMNTPGLSSDDIMIADWVSFISKAPFEDIINSKLESKNWQEVTAELDILYSFDKLPRVQITNDEINRYINSSGLVEEQVIKAFVIAHKLELTAEDVISKLKDGYTDEAIYAEKFFEKYY